MMYNKDKVHALLTVTIGKTCLVRYNRNTSTVATEEVHEKKVSKLWVEIFHVDEHVELRSSTIVTIQVH